MRSDLRTRYLNTLGLTGGTASPKDALARAYQLRGFEIEHYWKRSTYFWAFQVAIFAAFGLLWKQADAADWGIVSVALASLEVLTALANSLSALGSKFWQQNWEYHIDMLEDKFEGRLHKTVWLTDGLVRFSVSRVNEILGYFFVVFWVIVLAADAWKFTGSPSLHWPACLSFAWLYVFFILLLTVVGAIYLFRQTTNLDATLPKRNGDHGDLPLKSRRILLGRRVRGAYKRDLLRRYAPDELP